MIIRPFWIDYQVTKKINHLNQYLEEKYPNEEWGINRLEERQYNPYHFIVEFKNEQGWAYSYSLVNESYICQNSWSTLNG